MVGHWRSTGRRPRNRFFAWHDPAGIRALARGRSGLEFLRAMLAEGPKIRGSVRVQVDIDPQSFM